MSNQITIAGLPPYDGSYELDFDVELTTREWGWVKRLAGYLPLTLTDDAFGDPELICAFAVIAMRRAGRLDIPDVQGMYDRLLDAPFGSAVTFTIADDDEEDTGRPPPANSNSNGATSGTGSPTNSGTPATRQKPTGSRGSGTSASDPQTSVT